MKIFSLTDPTAYAMTFLEASTCIQITGSMVERGWLGISRDTSPFLQNLNFVSRALKDILC